MACIGLKFSKTYCFMGQGLSLNHLKCYL